MCGVQVGFYVMWAPAVQAANEIPCSISPVLTTAGWHKWLLSGTISVVSGANGARNKTPEKKGLIFKLDQLSHVSLSMELVTLWC